MRSIVEGRDAHATVLTRRSLLAGGAAVGALTAGGLIYEFTSAEDDRAIIAAIAPVTLGIPVDRSRIVSDFETAVATLPPELRGELRQLFGLLRFPLTRAFVAGVWHPWRDAIPNEIAQFLTSWRYSRYLKLRSAYDALHQLIMAAWYGDPESWRRIGYPGPPKVSS